MNYETVNPITYPGWNDLVKERPEGMIFHSANWARVLHDCYGYLPMYMTRFSGGKIAHCLPLMEVAPFGAGKWGVALPFTDYCEPLSDNGNSLEEALALGLEVGRSRGWKSLQLRGGANLNGTPSKVEFYLHELDLSPSVSDLFANFRSRTKRNIRKSEKAGVEIRHDLTLDGMKEFYRLHALTRKRHGAPPQPFSFFKSIHQQIIEAGLGTVLLAYHEGKVVAGLVFFIFNGNVIYKFGASDFRFQQLRANNLLMWEGIKWSKEEGANCFSFGRTDLDNEGLRHYKISYGANERLLCYHLYNIAREGFETGSFGLADWQKKIFSHTPVPILELIGSALYKRMG